MNFIKRIFYSPQRALLKAVAVGNLEEMERLLDTDLADETISLALIRAGEIGNRDVILLLLSRGASIDAADQNGDTALIKASRGGHTECVRSLLEKGANLNSQNAQGATCLMEAAAVGNVELIKCFLSLSADPNHKRKNGVTALILASHTQQIETAILLLKAKASTFVEGVDAEGQKLTIDSQRFVLCLAKALDLSAAPMWGIAAIALRNVTRQLLLLQHLGKAPCDKVQKVLSSFQLCEERLRTGTAPRDTETAHETIVMLDQLCEEIRCQSNLQPILRRIEHGRISLMLSVGRSTIEAMLFPALRRGDSKTWGDALDGGRAGVDEASVFMMDFTFQHCFENSKEGIHGGLLHLGCIWQDMCRLNALIAERGLDRQSQFEPTWLGALWPQEAPSWLPERPQSNEMCDRKTI